MKETVLIGPQRGTGRGEPEEILVAMVTLDDGDEATPVTLVGQVLLPLQADTNDADRMAWLEREAAAHARQANKPVRIVRYTLAGTAEVFHPDGSRTRP